MLHNGRKIHMKILRMITATLLTVALSGCSWLSSFFIINNTNNEIIITYELLPTDKNDTELALKDTIEFYKLVKDTKGNINQNKTFRSPINGSYAKTYTTEKQIISLTLLPQTAMTCGQGSLYNFSYDNSKKRHEIFSNVIQMKIYRMDLKDTIVLQQSTLADLSKPFNQTNIALIFD